MTNLISGIYKIENITNGDCYIGQSIKLNIRQRMHFHSLRLNKHDNRHLQFAYNKYGEESFKFTILLYCEIDELLYYEQALVDKLKPVYNIRVLCTDSNRGLKHTEESRKKMSEKRKGINNAFFGRHHTEETKLKLSETHLGENSVWFGKHHTEETKKKIGDVHRGKIVTNETKKLLSENHSDCTGENNSFYGKHHSEETKRKISEAKRGVKHV